MKASTIKKIRMFPLLILGYLLFVILLQAFISFASHNTVIFDASTAKKFPEKTYRSVYTKDFTFVTGTEGQVLWKPKSGSEKFYLEFFANEDAFITFSGSCYILIIDAILFWMLHDLKPENVFSDKILKGLNYIFFLTPLLLIAKGFFQYFVSDYLVSQLTHGMFIATHQIHFSIAVYFLGPLVFQQLTKFFFQAQKLEQEQELTV